MLCKAACVCCWLEQSEVHCMLHVLGVPARGMPAPGHCITDVLGRARLLNSFRMSLSLLLGAALPPAAATVAEATDCCAGIPEKGAARAGRGSQQ